MKVTWNQLPGLTLKPVSAVWNPKTGTLYAVALSYEEASGSSHSIYIRKNVDSWQKIDGDGIFASLVWHPVREKVLILVTSSNGSIWEGEIGEDIPPPNPTPTPSPIPPVAIKLDLLGYGNTNYGYGIDPFQMAAGQKTTFLLPIAEVINRPDYAYYPKKNIHKLNFHTAASPEGNGEIKILLKAPTGETWSGTNITADVVFNIWSQRYPFLGYPNYIHEWIPTDPWIVEIEAIKNSAFLIWWFPYPEGIV